MHLHIAKLHFMKTLFHPLAKSQFCSGPIPSFAWGLSAGLRACLGTLAVLIGLNATSTRAQVFVQDIAPPDLVAGQNFGQSVSASTSQFAVGTVRADYPNSTAPVDADAGAVYLFNLTTGSQTRKLFSPSHQAGAHFGAAVALAGNILAVGAPLEDDAGTDKGAVYLFNAATGVFLRQITAATANGGGGAEGAQFGFSLAMAGDFLVIGAPYRDFLANDAGGIYIYNLKTNVLSGLITSSTGTGADWHYGWSVALQGGHIAVGAPGAVGSFNGQGAAYLVDAATGAELHKFLAADPGTNYAFGTSVAFARDRLVVGAPGWNTNDGKVYAYSITPWGTPYGGKWSVAGGADSKFGASVAGSGDLVVIGAPDTPLGVNVGKVSVVAARLGGPVQTLENTTWQFDQELMGNPVAVVGNTVLAVAIQRNTRASTGGAVLKFSPVRSSLPFPESALKNSIAPGAPDTTFSTFNQLASCLTGEVVFHANVVGPGASLGRNSGIWYDFGDSSTKRVLRRTGMPLQNGGTRKPLGLLNPVNNLAEPLPQNVGFTAMTAGPNITSANDKVFVVSDPVFFTLKLPLVEGTTLINGGKLSTFQSPRQSYLVDGTFPKSFAVPFTRRLDSSAGVTAGNDSGVVIFNAAGIAPGSSTVSEGTLSPVPEVPGPIPYGQMLPRVSYPSNKIIYCASLKSPATTTNNLGVFYADGAVEAVLARKGSAAPAYTTGTVSGYFSNFLGEAHGYYSINPSVSGAVIHASVVPPPGFSNRDEGLWRWKYQFAELRLQLLKGDPDAAFPPGVTIKSFQSFGATLEDHIIAWVRLQGPGVTTANDGAILLSRNTYATNVRPPTTVLLREGFAAPGCGRARIGSIQTVDMGQNGSYVVLSSLMVEPGGATLSDNQALHLGAFAIGETSPTIHALPRLMLRKGTQFVRSGSPTVRSISLPGYTKDSTGAMNTGLARLVHADASYTPSCAAVVTFNDGQTSVMSIFP